MKLFVFLLILLSSISIGTTYYVNPASTDDTGDGTTATAGTGGTSAEKTIEAAINDCSTGDTIKLVAGTYNTTTQGAGWYIAFNAGENAETITIESYTTQVTLTFASATYGIYMTSDGGAFTLNNIALTRTGTPSSFIRLGQDVSNNFTFRNCDISGISGGTYFGYFEADTGTDTSVITFDTCTVSASCTSYGMIFNDLDTLKIINCPSFTLTSGNHVIFSNTSTDLNNVIIRNNIFDLPANYIFLSLSANNGTSYLDVSGNTIDECASLVLSKTDQTIGHWAINNNTVTSATAGNIINLGHSSLDVGDGGGPTNYLIGGEIIGNTLTASTSSGHPITVGKNVYGWLIQDNICINTVTNDYGIALKGKYNTVCNNYVKAPNALYLIDGCNNNIINNTFYGTTKGLRTENTYSRNPLYNNIQKNIFYSSGTYAASINDSDAERHYNNFFDYNIYYGGSSGIFQIDDATHSTIADLTADWLANYVAAPTTIYSNVQYNDLNSRMDLHPYLDADGYSRNPTVIELGAGRLSLRVIKKTTLGPQLYNTLGNTQ